MNVKSHFFDQYINEEHHQNSEQFIYHTLFWKVNHEMKEF